MANTELILGLAGIGGTALVGLGANYTTLSIERRRRRREDAAAQQRVREALRLVRSDLDAAAVRLQAAHRHRRWWLDSESLTAGHLDAYRELLAAELEDPRAWAAVHGAELVIDKVVTVVVAYQAQNMGEWPRVEGPIVELLQTAADACEGASKRLLEAEAGLGLGPRQRRVLARRMQRAEHGRDTGVAEEVDVKEGADRN